MSYLLLWFNFISSSVEEPYFLILGKFDGAATEKLGRDIRDGCHEIRYDARMAIKDLLRGLRAQT